MPDILHYLIIYPITLVIDFFFFLSIRIFKQPGIGIVIISLLISILCLPLYLATEKIQEKERLIQKSLEKKIKKIKSVFRGDEQYLILSAYYRQNNYHPFYALRSSLGLLVQIPFFIAAYGYISHLELIKGASFLFIKDLGSPDRLFLSINILPIAMTIINCLSSFVYSKGLPIRDKLQLYGISIIFLALLYNSPSGLVLYWTLNNIFSLLKNAYFKLQFRAKRHILTAIITLVSIFIVYYIYRNNISNEKFRLLLTCMIIAISGIAWPILLFGNTFSGKINSFLPENNSLSLFLLSLGLVAAFIGLYVPSALIGASPQEFCYIDSYSSPFPFIFISFLQAIGVFFLWPIFFYLLSSANSRKIFNIAVIFITLTILLNYFLFPGYYGYISLNMIFDNDVGHLRPEIALNFSLMAIIALAIVLLNKFTKIKFFIPVMAILLCSAIIVSATKYYYIYNEYKILPENFSNANQKSDNESGEPKPFFTLSREGLNVIVIMLDRANSSFIPYIFSEIPDLLDSYNGFTYYPNTLSFGENTRSGASALFGGYEYSPLEMNKVANKNIREKHNEALLLMPALLSRDGFAVTVADQPYPNYQGYFDTDLYIPWPGVKALSTKSAYSDYWINENNFFLPNKSDQLKRNILFYSVLKCSPLLLRPYIYYNGDWCSLVSLDDLLTMLDWYPVLDYLPRLSAIDHGNSNNCLILVNNTTHESALLQAPEYVPSINVNLSGTNIFRSEPAYHVSAAALLRLGEFFDFLKKEGAYDNTRIILVADHGNRNNFLGKNHPGIPVNLDAVNPLLMVKDFYSDGKLVTDDKLMTNADVPLMAVKGIIPNPVNPFTGKELTENPKKEPLYIAVSLVSTLQDANDTMLPLDPKQDYYVKDNIFISSNWMRADTVK